MNVDRPRLRWWAAVWLVLALLTKPTPDSDHEYSRLGTIQAIVEHGSYHLEESSFSDSIDKIFVDGHFYSHQAPLLATLEAPIYFAERLIFLQFGNRTRELAVFLLVWLTNTLALVLTAAVFSELLALAAVPFAQRHGVACALVFGTWLLPYGLVNNNHGIAGFLLVVMAYLLLAVEWRGPSPRRCGWLGLTLGLLTAIELLPVASFVPLATGYLWWRRDLPAAAWRAFGLALLLPLLAHAAINIPITGDVIPGGFHHELFHYPGVRLSESELSGTLKFTSMTEAGTYAWRSLFAGKGYFTFAPVLLLGLISGVVGWRWWGRARGPHLVLLGGTLSSLAVSLVTTNNFGGEAVGFRHATYLAPAMLTLLLPVFADPRPAARVVTWGVVLIAGLSAAALFLFAVPDPWFHLTLPPGPLREWGAYFPMVAKILRRGLLGPY